MFILRKPLLGIPEVFLTIYTRCSTSAGLVLCVLPEVGAVYRILDVVQGVGQRFEFERVQIAAFRQALRRETKIDRNE